MRRRSTTEDMLYVRALKCEVMDSALRRARYQLMSIEAPALDRLRSHILADYNMLLE
jgi:hypothetical protein